MTSNRQHLENTVEEMPAEHAAGLAELRAKAEEARRFGNVQTALAIEWSIEVMERSLRAALDAMVSLEEAVKVSGYTAGHLRRFVRDGELMNHGRDGAPLYRRSDLPINPRRTVAPPPVAPAKPARGRQFDARAAVQRALARSA